MKINYRTRVAGAAVRLISSGELTSETLFTDAYNEAFPAISSFIEADDMMLCTYAARISGVPTAIIPNMGNIDDVMEFYKSRSLYITDDSYSPKPGDFLVYNDRSIGIGVVVKIERGKVSYVTSSRYGDSVPQLKNIMAPSAFILGYITPDYDFSVTKGALRKTQLPAIIKGTRVKRFQQWLDKKLNEGAGINGKTDAAFKASCMAAWRRQMNRDCKSKLYVDGKFDDSCFVAAQDRVLKKGSSGNMVNILQGLLYSHGYDPKGFNGRFTDETEEALIAFQKARKLEQSGATDAQTWKSILTKW